MYRTSFSCDTLKEHCVMNVASGAVVLVNVLFAFVGVRLSVRFRKRGALSKEQMTAESDELAPSSETDSATRISCESEGKDVS